MTDHTDVIGNAVAMIQDYLAEQFEGNTPDNVYDAILLELNHGKRFIGCHLADNCALALSSYIQDQCSEHDDLQEYLRETGEIKQLADMTDQELHDLGHVMGDAELINRVLGTKTDTSPMAQALDAVAETGNA